MITFGRALGTPPPAGTWLPTVKADDVRTAVITCPNCGDRLSLDGHEIGDDGLVSPGVVCGGLRCDFDATIVLEHWDAPW